MDSISKEQIALELALASIEKLLPSFASAEPENVGKTLAVLYNSILDNLKD